VRWPSISPLGAGRTPDGSQFLRRAAACAVEFNLRQRQRGLALTERGNPIVQKSYLVFEILNGACNFQRRLLACASMPRTIAVAACRSAFAVSTAARFWETAI
jgi:hypothetical protein